TLPVVPLTWPVVSPVSSLSTLRVALVLPASLTAPVVGPLLLACETLTVPTLLPVAQSETAPEQVVGPGPPRDSLADAVLESLALIPSLAEATPSLPHAATRSGNDNRTTKFLSDILHDLSHKEINP